MSIKPRCALFAFVAICTSLYCLADTPGETPTTRPSVETAPRVKPPADQASEAEKYPSEQLVAVCRKEAQSIQQRLGSGFEVVVSPPFVVAGNMSSERMNHYARWSVVRPAKAMWASDFRVKPDEAITILLFGDDKSYRSSAKRLFGDERLPHFGYYKPDKRTLVMNIATGTGTLVHELTHALIVYDFPAVPTWFNEGLASLHEQCNVKEDEIVGLLNWRLPALQKAIAAGKLRPLRELLTAGNFYGPQCALNYAQARYFCMYMQERKLLRKFYAYFREHHAGTDADVKAVEKDFGRKIEDVEADFLQWARGLKPV